MPGELLDPVRREPELAVERDYLERLGASEVVFHISERRRMSKRDVDEGFVRTTQSAVPMNQTGITRVGTAWIGGNYNGNSRGDFAFDIQGERGSNDCVAGGGYAVALGNNNKAPGLEAIAIGTACEANEEISVAMGFNARSRNVRAVALGASVDADGDSSVSVGYNCQATQRGAVAIGHTALATASRGIALGANSAARKAYTANIGGLQIAKRCEEVAPENDQWLNYYATAEVYLLSDLINLKTTADYIVNLPLGCNLWLSECGLIAVTVTGLVTQPTVRFGVSGTPAKQVSAVLSTKLTAAGKRDKWAPLVPEDGETSISFGVTVAANATTMTGRCYWKGLLVEDED